MDDGELIRPGVVGTAVIVVAIALAAVIATRHAPAGFADPIWWPASGMACALAVTSRPQHRTATLAAISVAVLAGSFVVDDTPTVAVARGLAAGVEAWLFCLVLDLPGRTPTLRIMADTVRLLAGGAVGALAAGVLVTAAIGLDGDLGAGAGDTLRSTSLSHLAAIVMITPVALLAASVRSELRPTVVRRAPRWRRLELTLQPLATLVVPLLVFAPDQHLPLSPLTLPALIWGTLRCPSVMVAAEMLAVGVTASVLTRVGGGPFNPDGVVQPIVTGSLLQVYLVGLALAVLPLMTALGQRDRALRAEQRERSLNAAVLGATSGTAIIGTLPDGTITFFNSGAEAMLGYRAEEMIGTIRPELFAEPDDVVARARELDVAPWFDAVVAGAHGAAGIDRRDWVWARADGSRLTVSLTVGLMADDDGRPFGYLGVAEDVTERAETERALRQALSREREAVTTLQEVDRLRSEVVTTVSHELRTPLTSVLGFTQMLDRGMVGALTEEQHDLVGRIGTNTERLVTIVEDLLLLGRLDEGALPRVRERVDVGEVLGAAVGLVVGAPRPEITAADPAVVLGDRGQLERVVVNLLSNAVKFTPAEGRVAVSVTVDEPAGTVAISVTDTGVGIPHDEIAALGERFYRASTASQNAVPGTGLGLSIVHGILDLHDGRLEISSEVGVGTTVVATLPLAATP